MVKTIFGKVTWIGRATVFTVGLAVVLALMLGVATTAIAAAPGDPFRLGKGNVVKKLTILKSNAKSATLRLVNERSGSALDLRVKPGKPPMKVNSGGKVNRLNADRLDGRDSDQILPLLRAQNDKDSGEVTIPADRFVQANEISIAAPTDGFLVIWGSATLRNYSSEGTFLVLARLDGNGTAVRAQTRIRDGGSSQTPAVHATVPVSAGEHTVTLHVGKSSGEAEGWYFDGNNLSVMFMPVGRGVLTETET